MSGAQRIVVVGASLAGTRAAEALRAAGFIGDIALVCSEPSYPIADRPGLSKEFLLADEPVEPVLIPLRGDPQWRVIAGRRATSLDVTSRTVQLDDATEIEYHSLIVATGATPRRLGAPVPRNVHVLRDLCDAQRLRSALDRARSVAVIGAGVLGCEIAAASRHRGLSTTLIDVAARPMIRVVGDVVGGWIANLHRAYGVELVLGNGVARLLGEPDVAGVELLDGDIVDADVVVLALGATPEVGWLSGSGLRCDDGVLCDEYGFADGTDRRIVAAGDVARWHHPLLGSSVRVEHWTNAVAQGRVAGRNLAAALGGRTEFTAYAEPPYFWSDQFTWKMKLVGVPGPEVSIVEGSREQGSFVVAYRDGDRLVGVLGVNAPRALASWRRQVIPAIPGAGEFIAGAAGVAGGRHA